MAAVIDYYRYIFHDLTDKRTHGYFLADSPLYIVAIAVVYYYFVKDYGPNKLMKHRPAYNINKLLLVYNVFQILMNAYICIGTIRFAKVLNFVCDAVDYTNSYYGLFGLHITYVYFINKLIDLLDTIFFVLRKKQSQVTFLHIYHHMIMIVAAWVGFKYTAGGHTAYFGFMNSTVHVVMYFYYFLTAYDPIYKKSIWWKKHITQLQLIQFVAIFIIYTPLIFWNDCNYPKLILVLVSSQSIVMLVLFSKFYYGAYIKPKQAVVNDNRKKSA